MARSAVNTKLKQINEFLSNRNRQQEETDNMRDTVAKEIQIDLEERLQSSHAELTAIKEKLKSKSVDG